MKYHAIALTYFPEDPLPWGVDVWDTVNNERAENMERKFKTKAEAVIYRENLNVEAA